MRTARPIKTVVAATAAMVSLYGLAAVPASADGTETLGPPVGVAIAKGSGIVAGGVGLVNGPGTLNVNVPANAGVTQALLYWEGQHSDNSAGDSTIVVNGQTIQGTKIGGPTFFFVQNGIRVTSTAFRADITSRKLVKPGVNALAVSGLSNNVSNNGAGLVAVIDDGSDVASIQVRDGLDLAFANFTGQLQTTTAQTFTVPAASFSRTAKLNLQVASAEGNRPRPNAVRIQVGNAAPVEIFNTLKSTNGPEWDSVDFPVVIPAGVTTVKVQVLSKSDGSGNLPSSIAWVAATLAVGTCPPASATPANTSGSAYGVDARALGLTLADRLNYVESKAPGEPANSAAQLFNVDSPNLVKAAVVTTSSNSSLNPSATTASATVLDANLLNGLVTASVVKAVSQSTASTSGATTSSAGSTITGLKVNNAAVNVAPNTKVLVKNPLNALLPAVAELYIYEEVKSSSFGSGASKSAHSVNMLRLRVLSSIFGVAPGTEVVLAHAESRAQSPTLNCPQTKSVSGEAFTALVKGNLGGQQLAETKIGDAVLPATGGSDSDTTTANVPGVVSSTTASNTTSGSLTPTPNATSRSVTQGVSLFNGAITADLLDVQATSAANGTTASTNFAVKLANLKIGATTVDTNPSPNTQFVVPLGGNTLVSVIVNEQVKSGNNSTDTAGTVNALHARVFVGNVLTGEVIVASAHSDAHF